MAVDQYNAPSITTPEAEGSHDKTELSEREQSSWAGITKELSKNSNESLGSVFKARAETQDSAELAQPESETEPTSPDAEAQDPYAVGANVPVVPAEELNRAINSSNPSKIIENGWTISEIDPAENGREETYILEKPTYEINDQGETVQGQPRKMAVPLTQIINWRNDANSLNTRTAELQQQTQQAPEATPAPTAEAQTPPEAPTSHSTEKPGFSMAEILDRLKNDDHEGVAEGAAQVATKLGRAAFKAKIGVVSSSEGLHALKEAEAAQNTTGNKEPIGLKAFLKNQMQEAVSRVQARLAKYNQSLYGTTEATDTATEQTAEGGADTAETASPEATATTPTAEKEHTENTEQDTNTRLQAFIDSLGLGKLDTSTPAYAKLRKSLEAFISDQQNQDAEPGPTKFEAYSQRLKQQSELYRQAALAKKAKRVQARQEFFNGLTNAGKESLNNLRTRARNHPIGRAIRFTATMGRFMGRGLKHGFQAGRRAYEASNQ